MEEEKEQIVIEQKEINKIDSEQQNQEQEKLYFNKSEYENIVKKIDELNLEQSTESEIPISIIGILKQECRYFPSKKKDGNDIAFASYQDEEKECEIQIIIQRNRIKNQLIFDNFKQLCQMLRQSAVVHFQGNLGLAKYNKHCIYASDFSILKIQAQPIIALKWCQLYQHNLINLETACLAMQICELEMQQLQKLGEPQMAAQIGSTDFGGNSKTQNKFKMRIVEICRALQNKPMTKVSIRPPKYPRVLYQNLEFYEKKYSSCYTADYIIEEKLDEISHYGTLLENNLPQNINEDRIQYFNQKKIKQVNWFIVQLKKMEQKTQKPFKHFVDVGGGRGDLSLTIAQFFPDSFVTVIDINESSLKAGEEFAKENGITNIQFCHQSVEDLQQDDQNKYDIVVGLHACGGLSDAILNFSVKNKLNFFLCTCCFSSNFNLIPAGFLEILQKMYRCDDDRYCLCRFSESNEGYSMAERCMKLVNTFRLNTVKQIFQQEKCDKQSNQEQYDEQELQLSMIRFDKNFSPKNFILQGIVNHNKEKQ